jgi:hypothetical protein
MRRTLEPKTVSLRIFAHVAQDDLCIFYKVKSVPLGVYPNLPHLSRFIERASIGVIALLMHYIPVAARSPNGAIGRAEFA